MSVFKTLSAKNNYSGEEQVVRTFSDTQIKTPYGYMELLGITQLDDKKYICAKELTSENWRFFSVDYLEKSIFENFEKRHFLYLIIAVLGLLITVIALVNSFVSYSIVKDIVMPSATPSTLQAGNNLYPNLQMQILRIVDSPLFLVLGMASMAIGAYSLLMYKTLTAMISMMSAIAFLKAKPIVRAVMEIRGTAVPSNNITQTANKVIHTTVTKLSFEPGVLSSSIIISGVLFTAYILYKLFSKINHTRRLKSVTIPEVGTFDLFTMCETPDLPEIVLKAFHRDCDKAN